MKDNVAASISNALKSTHGCDPIDAAEIRLSQAQHLFQAIIDTADIGSRGANRDAARSSLMSLARIGCDLMLAAQEELRNTANAPARPKAA